MCSVCHPHLCLHHNPYDPKSPKTKWEKALPGKLTIATAEEASTSLKLKVEIETTDTVERKFVVALLDSSAMGECIDRDYVKSQRFNLLKLTNPIPVYNIDRSPNEAGLITEVVSLILCYKNHSEQTLFCITSLGKQKLILGHSWLHKHNPEIDWTKGEVKMSRCPLRCCSGCCDEICLERIAQKADAKRRDACSIGPMLEISHDFEEDLILETVNPEDEPISVEEGDWIIATGLLPTLSIDIHALSTISQRLVEAFQANTEAVTLVLEYLKEFTSVFSKQSFDVLLETKEWDHAVELIPGSKLSTCKVYPLSPAVKKELNVFLKENLETGQIQPSKSLMSSPVFFIKKKDSSLHLVQDYQALNAITMKNKYPLPLISKLINKLQGARYFTKLLYIIFVKFFLPNIPTFQFRSRRYFISC